MYLRSGSDAYQSPTVDKHRRLIGEDDEEEEEGERGRGGEGYVRNSNSLPLVLAMSIAAFILAASVITVWVTRCAGRVKKEDVKVSNLQVESCFFFQVLALNNKCWATLSVYT